MQSRRIRPSPTGNPWQAVRKLPWAEEALSASTRSRNYWPSFIGQSLFLFVSGGLLSMRATLVVEIVYQSFDPDQIKREISLRSSWCEQLLGLGCVLDSSSFCMLGPNGLGAGEIHHALLLPHPQTRRLQQNPRTASVSLQAWRRQVGLLIFARRFSEVARLYSVGARRWK